MNNIIEAEYKEITPLQEKNTKQLTVEVNTLYSQAEILANAALTMLAEAGRRLNVIKEREGHGNWMSWCENNLSFSYRKAKNMMDLAKKMEGNNAVFSNLQTFANIEISKVWALLSAPEEVQKEVADNPAKVEGTVREFKEEIKRLKNKYRELEEKKNDTTEFDIRIAKLTEELEHSQEIIAELEASTDKDSKKKVDALLVDLNKLEKKLRETEEVMYKQAAQLKKVPEKVIDEEAMNKAVNTAVEEANRKAERKIAEAENSVKRLQEEIGRIKKGQNSTLAVFQSKFNTFRDMMSDIIIFIEADQDEEEAGKMRKALAAALEKMKGELDD